MMDHEASVFHLATAVQENQFVIPRPFCPHSTPTAYVHPSGGFHKNGLIGALIGGIIAGIALTTISVFIVRMCWQQRQIEREEKAERIAAKRLKRLQTAGFEPMEEVTEEDRERTPLVRRMRFWV